MAMLVDLRKLTLRDALDLAIAVEEEAATRYDSLADRFGSGPTAQVGAFFREMAETEQAHAERLRARRFALFQEAPKVLDTSFLPSIEATPGEPPEHPNVLYALRLVLEAEIRAYRFYGEALGAVHERSVRRLFNDLIAEERVHELLVRRHLERLKPH